VTDFDRYEVVAGSRQGLDLLKMSGTAALTPPCSYLTLSLFSKSRDK